MIMPVGEHEMERPDDIVTRTRAYIRENFLYMRPDAPLDEDTPLLGAGILDSVGVLELIEFIEQAFGVRVDDDAMTEENLGTIRAIAAFVTLARQRVGPPEHPSRAVA
jgi:acyl carrier protein